MTTIIDHGLSKWKANFITRTILVALTLSSFIVFCFYFHFENRTRQERFKIMEEVAQHNTAFLDGFCDSVQECAPVVNINVYRPKK